jgi:hypothetical protein
VKNHLIFHLLFPILFTLLASSKWKPICTILSISIVQDEKSMLDAALMKLTCARIHNPQQLLAPCMDIEESGLKRVNASIDNLCASKE